jgi:hypothetical protein
MALLVCSLAAPAASQESGLGGTYALDRQRSGDINAAIERTVRRMSFIARPIARSRLRRTNAYHQRMSIDLSAGRVSMRFDDGQVIDSPLSGEVIRWRRDDGEVLDLSTRWQGARLVQSFTADDGGRVNTYTLSEDGRTLTMHVVVSSPRLPAPLEYDLVYSRAAR